MTEQQEKQSVAGKFFKAYIKSMRPYYSFVTGIAGWLGVAFYQYVAKLESGEHIARSVLYKTSEVGTPVEKQGVILLILFLSWGINQIFNDYWGLAEDRLNAPDRPMVTGELDPKKALSLSVGLMAVALAATWFYLEPVAIIPLLAGAFLNWVYEHAKGYGILANIVFGIMIAMCTIFGFFAAGPTRVWFTRSRVAVLVLVAVMNGLMTFFTYFKDYWGDRAVGKRTVIVKYGLRSSRIIGVVSSFLPSALFLLFYYPLQAIEIDLNKVFVILGIATFFLQIWTGYLYYRNPIGKMTYYSLATNFRACACGQAALVALFNPELGMLLFFVTYIFVGVLFDLHANVKA